MSGGGCMGLGSKGGEWSVMRGDDGGGEDGDERIEVAVWHRERLDMHGKVGELNVKRGDVWGKEEVVERSVRESFWLRVWES